MSQSFSGSTESDWQGVDAAPTLGSKNLVESGGISESLNKKPQLFLFAEASNYIDLITTGSTLKLTLPATLTAVFGNTIQAVPGGTYDVEFSVYSTASNCFLVYSKLEEKFKIHVGRILDTDYLIAAIRNSDTITSSTVNLSIESYKSFAVELAVNGKFKGDRLFIADDLENSNTLPKSSTLYNTYKKCKNNVQFSYGLLDFLSTSVQIKVNNNSVIFLDNERYNISAGTYDIDKTSLTSETSTYFLCVINTSGTLSFKFVVLSDITALNDNVYVLSILRMYAASGSMSPSVASVVVETIDNSILVDGLPLLTSNTVENSNTKIASSHAASLADRFAHFEARCIRIAASSMKVVCDFNTYLRCGYDLVNLTPGQYSINVSYCNKNRTDYILCVDANKDYNVFTNVFYLIPHPYYNATQLPENFYIVCFINTEEPVTTSSTSMVVKTISEDILVNRKLLSYAQEGIDVNNEELRDCTKYIRKISGKYNYILAHFAGGGMLQDHPISYRDGNVRYLPEYSITNVMLAKQMGFDGLGINVHSTSDGVLVCCHDAAINRTFRNKSDYSSISGTVNIADHTYAELAAGYVCETQIERLRGAILKLEDVIITCKNINLGIAIIPDGSIMTAVANLMQKYDFTDWMFIGTWRPDGAGLVMHLIPIAFDSLESKKSAATVVSELNTIAKPASVLFAAVEGEHAYTYSNAEIQEIAEACHKAGYGVAIDTYGSKEEIQKFRNWGCFDITSVDNEIPSFENGNYISLSSVADFSEFTCSDASTVGSGVLPIGKTISYYGQEEVKDFVGVTLKIQFEGTINLTFGQGYNSVEFTSDGSKEEVFTNIFFDEYVGFEIEAVTSTNIQNIKLDAKR